MKKFICVFVAALLCIVSLAGCGGPAFGHVFRYDIPGPIFSLDPQFVTDPNAVMIVGNLFEGLVTRSAVREILPGAAKSWDISPDGMVYTFTLREGLSWSNGTALTGGDFVFAMRRLFNNRAPSPYAGDYLSIQNAAEILAGEISEYALGVLAPDDHTVIFRLHRPDPFFLELLAATPALPCNKEFFDECRGRYGLERRLLLSNGPFTLKSWDNTKSIVVERSGSYVSETPVLAATVHFYIGRENPVNLFLSGKSDVVIASYSQLDAARQRGAGIYECQKTTWCIVFNQSDRVLGNPLIRQGFYQALDHEMYAGELAGNFTPASVLVPPAMMLADRSYRDLAGSRLPLTYDPQRGAYLFEMGLDALELDALPPITFLVPDSDAQGLYMGLAGQSWQKHLGAFLNIQPAPPHEIEQQLAARDYKMALIPFTPGGERVSLLLGVFDSNSRQNYFGYRSGFYDEILLKAADEHTLSGKADHYRRAENMLLSDAVVIPVYFESTYYAVGSGITGIEIHPISNIIYFKRADKH